MIQKGEEYLTVCGRFDGHRRDHAACADGTQDGEDLPSAVGRRFMNALSARTTRIEPRPLRRDATFIQVNQVFRRGVADFFDKLRTPLSVGFRVPFLGVE